MYLIAWIAFIAFVLVMLAIDLGVLHKKRAEIGSREALRWTGFCAFLALSFNVLIYFLYKNQILGFGANPAYPATGLEAAMQFFSAWLLEQTLSLDNVFIIAVIFSYFKIPSRYQHRVLFWGIVGALVMRGLVIGAGEYLLNFEWAHLLFGGLLIYAAIKMLMVNQEHFNPDENIFYKIALKLYPLSKSLDGERFFTVVNSKRAITPLFVVLMLIETTDVLFALDSIPAVFAITEDPFLVFTSNIFAILSLRSMYFALAVLVNKFRYLKTSLLGVLLFVGGKMILSHYITISTPVSFAVIVTLIAGGVIASLFAPVKKV